MYFVILSVINWNMTVKHGTWEGPTSGGCRNFPTFAKNPQIVMDLFEDDSGDGKISCLVVLMQKNRGKLRSLGDQNRTIGFSIYKV